MQSSNLRQILENSANEVLEAMFFTGVSGEAAETVPGPHLSAELAFRGTPSGCFGIEVPLETGRTIASNFLGADGDELSKSQISEVVGELTNMICGTVLSHLNANGQFELLSPEVQLNPRDRYHAGDTFHSTFALEDGTLTLWISSTPSEETERK